MALRPLLRFQNPDSTRDLNDRSLVFNKGIFEGGQVFPATGLSVRITRFATVGSDGMFVREDDEENILSVADGTRNYIVLRSRYVSGGEPTVSLESLTEAQYLGDSEGPGAPVDYLIVFAVVDVPAAAASVTDAMLEFYERDVLDPLGRLSFRGQVNTVQDLPGPPENPDPQSNLPGDFYIITNGEGDFPEIWAWNGVTFLNITQAQNLIGLLNDHIANNTNNRKHLTNDQFEAVAGTTGTPSDSNRFVTNLDARIPTQDENDALQEDPTNLSGELSYAGNVPAGRRTKNPSDENRFVTASKIFATPAEKAFSGGASIQLSVNDDGAIYVGTGGLGTAQVYFNIMMPDTTDDDSDRELINSQFQGVRVTGVFVEPSLNQELNPATNGNVDGLGFWFPENSSLYLGVSDLAAEGQADVDFRIVYAKRTEMGDLRPEAFILRGPQFGQVDHRVQELLASNVNASFADAIWNAGTSPGDVVAFDAGEFILHNNGLSFFPVGLRGNSNNLVMEGLYTYSAPTIFGAGDEVYASDVTPGELSTVPNDRFIGTFISDTELLVNMNGIGISPSTFVPGTSFPASFFSVSLSPGEACAWNKSLSEFEEWDDATQDAPLGIRGNSNNVIQSGLYTAAGSPFLPGFPYYASTTTPGALTFNENDYRVGFTLSGSELFVNIIGQPNWINARDRFEQEHSTSASGVHLEGSARTFVGLASEAGPATSGSLSTSTGMVLFATDTGQVFHCTNGSADTWVEASRFSGPLEITNSLEVGGNLILPSKVLDDDAGDTMNPFLHAVRHQLGGSDPIPGIIFQILSDVNQGSDGISDAAWITFMTQTFDFTGRPGTSEIIWFSLANIEKTAFAGNRRIQARTRLDIDGGGFNVLGGSDTPLSNEIEMEDTEERHQIFVMGSIDNLGPVEHTLEIQLLCDVDATEVTCEDRMLMILDLGSS